MIPRVITPTIQERLSNFPIVSLTGARQTGKTTLLREMLPDWRYINLEDPTVLEAMQLDPKNMLQAYGDHIIFDEAQRFPELFSYLQVIVDEKKQVPGQYILSGSQNFLLLDNISQSLAGRVGILHLLPLAYKELEDADKTPKTMDEWLYKGGYPRLYDGNMNIDAYYSAYVESYVERDVRHELGVRKLAEFRTFLTQCALHTGELVNYSKLAQDSGIDRQTVLDWISILESSFIVRRLYPYHRNYGKRLVKTPKLYFYDSGLAAHLIGIEAPEELTLNKYRGALFENMVVSEILKSYYARGREPRVYFWRDSVTKQEIDIIIERGGEPYYVIEVKASQRYDVHAFGNIDKLADTLGVPVERRIVINGADMALNTKHGRIVPMSQIDTLFDSSSEVTDAQVAE